MPGLELNSAQLMDKIINALDAQRPLSIVSVGQTEAFVMAQYTIYSEEEFMKHREAYNANRGENKGFFHRGIRFPNRAARDLTVDAVRQADIIAYNTIVESARQFTLQVFNAYEIEPAYFFEANIRRVFMFSQKHRFEQILQGRKVLLISSLAPRAQAALATRYQDVPGFRIVKAISIYEYQEIPQIQEQLAREDFDICFLAAGVNAVILASYIKQYLGKVAFDIGWGMQSFIDRRIVSDAWVSNHIGLENLFHM